jgi:hypothetical protein
VNAETAWPLARKQEAKTTLPWYNTCRFAKRWLKNAEEFECDVLHGVGSSGIAENIAKRLYKVMA